MKQDYETAQVTIGNQPFQTYHSRAQAYLIYPAKGRSEEQHFNDYQKLAAAANVTHLGRRLLQSAYVVGMAKSDPDKAIDWARKNIPDFDSKPNIRNVLFNIWKRYDESNANRWISNHPELDINTDAVVKTAITYPVVINQRKTTITLPR